MRLVHAFSAHTHMDAHSQKIEPVKSGHRWVLTYSLITWPNHPAQSAHALTERLLDLTNLLTRWEESPTRKQFLVYPLEYQYTNAGLKMGLLKGRDSHQAGHILQGCQEHGRFYLLLGNMELVVTDPNDEAEDEEFWERELFLNHIVDVSGFELLEDSSLCIAEDTLLRDIYGEDRGPDTQRGGGHLGNSHAEIDQVYKDSVCGRRHLRLKRQTLTLQVSGLNPRSET